MRRAVPVRKRRSKPSRPKGPRPSSAKRYSHSFLDSNGTLKTRTRRRRSAAPPKAPNRVSNNGINNQHHQHHEQHQQRRLRKVDESETETFSASNLFAISNRNKMRVRRRTDIIRYARRMDSVDFQRRHSANHELRRMSHLLNEFDTAPSRPSKLLPLHLENERHNEGVNGNGHHPHSIAVERVLDDGNENDDGICINHRDGLYPKRRSIKMSTPRPGRVMEKRRSLPVVVPMMEIGEDRPMAKREIMHCQNQIKYTIRARYERSILVIRVVHIASKRVFRNEFTQSDFPNKSIYAIAKTLIHGISKSTPISVHEYGHWCYLSLVGADIPSFALRPVKDADGGKIGSLV